MLSLDPSQVTMALQVLLFFFMPISLLTFSLRVPRHVDIPPIPQSDIRSEA